MFRRISSQLADLVSGCKRQAVPKPKLRTLAWQGGKLRAAPPSLGRKGLVGFRRGPCFAELRKSALADVLRARQTAVHVLCNPYLYQSNGFVAQ